MIYHNLVGLIIYDLVTMTTDEHNYLKKIGENISNLRKEKNLSQLDIGDIINMEKSNLSAIENGRQNPATLTLKKIADAIGCEVIDFFKI